MDADTADDGGSDGVGWVQFNTDGSPNRACSFFDPRQSAQSAFIRVPFLAAVFQAGLKLRLGIGRGWTRIQRMIAEPRRTGWLTASPQPFIHSSSSDPRNPPNPRSSAYHSYSHSLSQRQSMPQARWARASTAPAFLRALAAPAARTSRTSSGRAAHWARRSRAGPK